MEHIAAAGMDGRARWGPETPPWLCHQLLIAEQALRTVAPDYETRQWSRHSDLNRGPAVYETAALPLSYVGARASIGDDFGQLL